MAMVKRYPQDEGIDVGLKMVTFSVGQPGTIFLVYEDIIRDASDYVKTTLQKPWLRAQERVIRLPQMSRVAFELYHRWLLTGKLHSRGDCCPTSVNLRLELGLLGDAVNLGHYLIDTSFIDAISDALIQCVCEIVKELTLFPVVFGAELYDLLPDHSCIKSLVCELIAWAGSFDEIATIAKNHRSEPPDFAIDVLDAVRAKGHPSSKSPFTDWEKSCKHHSHGSQKRCYREGINRNLSKRKRKAEDDAGPADKKRK